MDSVFCNIGPKALSSLIPALPWRDVISLLKDLKLLGNFKLLKLFAPVEFSMTDKE